MITVQNITKSFDSNPVLKHISFNIAQGEIVGFLGPNGAGKTTLMRILTSYLSADSGIVTIAGHTLPNDSLRARRKIGYLPETPPLYPDMTVRDYLGFAAQLKNIDSPFIKRQIEKVLSDCLLNDVKNKLIGTLSKGYKQRVGIAQAIIHDPQVLILDEPTSGLDPAQIIQVRHLLKNIEHKRTVLLSTHILPEIEQMAKRVIILKRGEIVADNNLADLLKSDSENATLENVFLKLTE